MRDGNSSRNQRLFNFNLNMRTNERDTRVTMEANAIDSLVIPELQNVILGSRRKAIKVGHFKLSNFLVIMDNVHQAAMKLIKLK